MKKILILFTAIFSFAVIFTGCGFKDMEVPQTVSIKTDAVYEFPILDLSSPKMQEKLDLSNLLDIEKLLGSEDESESKFKVYKYNNGSKYQQYLLHMPLTEVEFDFSKSFGDMDFSTIMQEGFSIDKEITIPTVGSIDKSEPLDLSAINTTLNAGVTFTGKTYSSDLKIEFEDISGTNFESIEYKSGSYIIDASIDPLGRSPQGTMTLVYKDGTNPEKILSSGTFNNKKAVIDIANQKISKTGMYLRYTGSDVDVPFLATISTSSKIAKATNVTLPDDSFSIPPVEVTIPFSMGEDLGDVTINDGSLTVELKDNWEADDDVINDYTIEISGGLNCEVSKAQPTKTLTNAKITNEDIKASADVTILLHNANIDFDNPPMVNVKTDIKEVTAEVTMPDSFQTQISQDVPLPSDLSSFVNWISWKEVGFDIVANNSLPEGNDITINIWSDAFGIAKGSPKTIVAGEETTEPLSFTNKTEGFTTYLDGATEIPEGKQATTSVDVNGEIGLPGAQNGKLIVSHVEPGATYTVSLTVTPKFDFKKANIKMPENTNFNGNFNTSINKKTMFESLGEEVADALDNIKIDKLPLYLYANVPDILGDDSGFKGIIKTYYGIEKDDGTIEPVGTEDDVNYVLADYDEASGTYKAANIDFIPMPELKKNAKDEVIVDLGKELINFASALNSSPSGAGTEGSTLCISYDVGLGGTENNSITLTEESLNTLKSSGSTKISIDVALLLNLNFTLSEPIKIDLMELMNSSEDDSQTSGTSGTTTKTEQERDLLGRAEKTDTSSYEQYLDAVKSASLIIEKTELPIAGTLKLAVNMYNDSDYDEDKEAIRFGNKQTTVIEISPAKFLKEYPLEPSIKLIIGEGENSTFGLLRDAKVSGKIKAKVVANKDKPIQVYPFSEQNNGGAE